MDIYTLLMILLAIIVFLFFVSIFKKVLKYTIILGVIFFLLFYFTNVSLSDYDNLKDNITKPVVVILDDVGFVTGEKYDFLSKEESLMKRDDLLGENYKIYYLDIEAISEDIEINNKLVSKEELYQYFKNKEKISAITYEDLELKIQGNEEKFDSALLAYYYNEKLKPSKNPVLFFKNYKEGYIEVYPNSIFYKVTKIVPFSWIEGKINKLKKNED